MELFLEILQFTVYTGLIVLISKYVLVKTLRNLAENLKLKSKTKNDILGVVEATNNLLTSNIMNLFIIQAIGIAIFSLLHG